MCEKVVQPGWHKLNQMSYLIAQLNLFVLYCIVTYKNKRHSRAICYRCPATGEDQEYVLVGLRPFSVEFEITAFLSPIGEILGIKSAVEDKPQITIEGKS